MTTIAGPVQGAFSDPYSARGHNAKDYYNSTSSQFTPSGAQPSSLPTVQESPQPANEQPPTKALAITSIETKGTPPPPLMGSAIVLVNDSAMHCFGGRLENREITNCHYVLDVEMGYWQVIQAAPAPGESKETKVTGPRTIDPKTALFSLSLSTDPVHSTPLSATFSVPPRPRYFHSLNAYGTSLIVFGGMGLINVQRNDGEDSDNEGHAPVGQPQLAALDDLHVYDIVTQKWQQKYPQINEHTPKARWAHLATVINHYLVVIGGTDTAKAYVQDACVLDLRTWEWIASVKNIGQCGSYRTVAATGPSVGASGEFAPSSHSFPAVDATSPQMASNPSWPSADSGPIDVMASISMVLSGRISVPSTISSTLSMPPPDAKDAESNGTTTNGTQNEKAPDRLKSGELTPAFKPGKNGPSVYLYSNYNFQNLQRELKVLTPVSNRTASTSSAITLGSSAHPSFVMEDKSHTLDSMGDDLPPGLRFPQGHVYQNQMILTGTLIEAGQSPTMAIYSFNLALDKWERLHTESTLVKGSWNRTILHPATGTLLIFGKHDSNPEQDYSTRIQHHDHIMMINLQAYGLYERPVPSFILAAQDLGQELLNIPGLSDMHIASVTGKLFDANSTILAARWPDFASMLLSPPYVTPLILVLPVPDEVVPIFLHYLYTGALPMQHHQQSMVITPGVADYLLILARRHQLHGLHALTMDLLHQGVVANPIRIYSTALMAGELGLQARAVGLAMTSPPPLPSNKGGLLAPSPSKTHKRISSHTVDSGLSRTYSERMPPPTGHLPIPPEGSSLQRSPSVLSRDSMSTDGGFVNETLMQQYDTSGRYQDQRVFMSSPEPPTSGGSISGRRPLRNQLPTSSGMSYINGSSGSFFNDATMGSSIRPRGSSMSQMSTSPPYSSTSLSPSLMQQATFSSSGSYFRRDSDAPSLMSSQDDFDDGYSGHQDLRTQQAKRRLQMQMQMENQQHNTSSLKSALDYHMGGGGGTLPSNTSKVSFTSSQITTESVETLASQKSGSGSSKATSIKSNNSDKEKDKAGKDKDKKEEKKKGFMSKMKPPKPTASGADLMKSAGF